MNWASGAKRLRSTPAHYLCGTKLKILTERRKRSTLLALTTARLVERETITPWIVSDATCSILVESMPYARNSWFEKADGGSQPTAQLPSGA